MSKPKHERNSTLVADYEGGMRQKDIARNAKHEALRKDFADGASRRELSAKYGYSYKRVTQIIRRDNCYRPVFTGPHVSPEMRAFIYAPVPR